MVNATARKSSKNSVLVVSFIFGAVIAFTPMFGPIHEIGHLFVDPTATMHWTWTDIDEWNIRHIQYGHISEIVIWGLFAIIGSASGKARTLGMFCLGSAVGAYLMFYVSGDFLDYGRSVLEHYGFEDIRHELTMMAVRWTFIGPIFLAGPAALVRYALKVEAKSR